MTTVRVPCAEVLGGLKLEVDAGLNPREAGWQLLFRGYGRAVIFNALPLTFLIQGELVAQVIAIRPEGEDWWGLLVPEPAPKSAEEADERFGPEAKVGEVMRQIEERIVVLKARSSGATTLVEPKRLLEGNQESARPRFMNRHERRKHEALVRRRAVAAFMTRGSLIG